MTEVYFSRRLSVPHAHTFGPCFPAGGRQWTDEARRKHQRSGGWWFHPKFGFSSKLEGWCQKSSQKWAGKSFLARRVNPTDSGSERYTIPGKLQDKDVCILVELTSCHQKSLKKKIHLRSVQSLERIPKIFFLLSVSVPLLHLFLIGARLLLFTQLYTILLDCTRSLSSLE